MPPSVQKFSVLLYQKIFSGKGECFQVKNSKSPPKLPKKIFAVGEFAPPLSHLLVHVWTHRDSQGLKWTHRDSKGHAETRSDSQGPVMTRRDLQRLAGIGRDIHSIAIKWALCGAYIVLSLYK